MADLFAVLFVVWS